jgi:Uma2 family endonuclease
MVLLTPPITYPDADGLPMSDNTEQFRWIVLIKENLEILFAADPMVFVAGDLLWYSVQGQPKVRQAPDAMVVFGRPKGKRGSYQQWKEENIPPHVVFEVLSPGNTLTEMAKKLAFYNHHDVEEYYLYDPDKNDLSGWLRVDGELTVIDDIQNWVSPRLGIKFILTLETLEIYCPDGDKFLSSVELNQQKRLEKLRADREAQARQLAEERAEQLAQRLRELGINI